MKRLLFILMTCLMSYVTAAETIEIREADLAGISGFRQDWNRPILLTADGARKENAAEGNKSRGVNDVADWWAEDTPGFPAFDAIHRSLLVRFPSAPRQLAEQLAAGKRIEKLEVVLPFVDTEYYPLHYKWPAGLSFHGKTWVEIKPRWHAIGWALKRPWVSHPRSGPTYNSAKSGNYGTDWSHFGAQADGDDRFGHRFGPAEVSYEVTNGAMDVTAVLTDESFGPTLGDRLKLLEQAGFMIRKWETYDEHFAKYGGYEWSVCTGGRGILVEQPYLRVTLAEGEPQQVDLPKTAAGLTARESRQKNESKLLARLPAEKEIQYFIETYGHHQPAGMPDWQWQRIKELLYHSQRRSDLAFPTSVEGYAAWIDDILSEPYRRFSGHHTNMSTILYHKFEDALPPVAREHIRKNWETWLYPGVPYTDLVHNLGKQIYGATYLPDTKDAWRGQMSYFRESYTRYMSTQNFNYISCTGALLGGYIIDDEYALADGRYGLEYWPLRLWSWFDGTGQESIDHYYLGLSMVNQKNFADYAERQFERLMGKSGQLKNLDELIACWHPGLRKFIAVSGRTGMPNLLGTNEGPNNILHTLSREGALHDLDNPEMHGMHRFGHDAPPELIAEQAIVSPFGPLWMSTMIDQKPLPSELVLTERAHGVFHDPPLNKKIYLGRHYGLASLDVSTGGAVPAMAQWRRESRKVENFQETGLLVTRFGVNDTNVIPPTGGVVGFQGGYALHLQHHNKRLTLFTPLQDLKHGGSARFPKDEGITSMQGTLALFNFQPTPTWAFFINGERIESFPATMTSADRLTVHDGVSYLGVVPIPGTDLGRDVEITIGPDTREPLKSQHGGQFRAQLLINFYLYKGDRIDMESADWDAITNAYTGYVLEIGDQSEWGSFDAFQQHVLSTALTTGWNDADKVVTIDYQSGGDHLKLAAKPAWDAHARRPVTECFVERSVNGRWPYLPKGIDRSGAYSQAGTAGYLTVNGAVLANEPGRMAYVLAEPTSGNTLFINPLPDPQYLTMLTPDGLRIEADGKLGMTMATVNKREHRLELEYASRDNEYGGRLASALYLFGFDREPEVIRNGQRVANLTLVTLDMQPAYVLPLSDDVPPRSAEAHAGSYRFHAAQRQAALTSFTRSDMSLQYEPGDEHYLSAQPQPGVYNLHRLWPNPSVLICDIPGGMRLETDGRVAMQRIKVDTNRNHVRFDYPPYAQVKFEEKATSLLLFGFPEKPTVDLHGTVYEGDMPRIEVNGETAWVVPLFGDAPDRLLDGLLQRLAANQEKLK